MEPAAQKYSRVSDRIRGRVGLGFIGTQSVPYLLAAPSGTSDMPGISGATMQTASVPTIGALFWTQATFGPVKALGVQVGVGLVSRGSGSQSERPGAAAVSQGDPSVFSMVVYAGLPFALSSGEHILLSLAPEVSFGFATGIVRPTTGVTAPPAMLGGTSFRLGARASAEIFLGFIGLPEVSIEAGFRVGLAVEEATVSVGAAKDSMGSTTLVTSLEGTPWNVFTSTIAARYYF